MSIRKPFHFIRDISHRLMVSVGAVGLTLMFFMVLPLMQAISKPPVADMLVHPEVNSAQLQAPDEPLKPEEEKPPEKEQEPPKLAEEPQQLDLSQLDLALDVGGGAGGFFKADLGFSQLTTVASANQDVDALFSLSDLDQKPRVISQASPVLNSEMRRKLHNGAITVYIIFVVDQAGRVVDPVVQRSSDPTFNPAALAAVKQWKFEPGKRNGQAVRFRMRVPITFPKG